MPDERGDSMVEDRLSQLPSVERLAASVDAVPHRLAVAVAREEIAAARARILDGGDSDAERLVAVVAFRVERLRRGSLVRVINATGVVLHTNLGRAPLAAAAAAAAADIAAAYSNVEYDLERGDRSNRQVHLDGLLCELTGAEAAMAVNNNAAAVLLALAATADEREVIVSRSQLVEIGGSFRIPDVLRQSGARLVEVGTTNRTRLSDYEAAITDRTGALLRVHQSNFRTVGFVEEAPLVDLCLLAAKSGIVVIDDLGSGALGPIFDEPEVRDSIGAGADLVCWSADKLLGGPQAGILCGRSAAIKRCREHPLARAVRLDKLQLAALDATLRLHRAGDQGVIPVHAMLHADPRQLKRRATEMADVIGARAVVAEGTGRPGGGALPLVELSGAVCEIDPGALGADGLARALRVGRPPVVARIARGRLILDPRTMTDADAEEAAEAVCAVLE